MINSLSLLRLPVVFLLIWLFGRSEAQPVQPHPLARRLELRNAGGARVEILWKHPVTGETVPYGELEEEEEFSFDSYVNHTFVIRSPNATTSVTVEEAPLDQILVLQGNGKLERLHPPQTTSAVPTASDIVSQCRELPNINEMVQCLKEKTAIVLEELNEEVAFQKHVRRTLAYLAENYTCADPTLPTTSPRRTEPWEYEGITIDVGILHEHPGSQIHILPGFIHEEECQAVHAEAAATLHRGTVADGKGGSKMSPNRKAWQAGIKVQDWTIQEPIANLKRRIFAYANHATGYNMTLPGQEDLMSIQYFGNGTNDPTPDRYMPHCDGDCDGLPHKRGGRVATMVSYCDVPDRGGSTNFQNANVHVRPTKYAAVFFSYMNPVTHHQEEGFTMHSGCPVLLGTKRIVVQWMRIGVDEENPWDSFDTNTISKKLTQ